MAQAQPELVGGYPGIHFGTPGPVIRCRAAGCGEKIKDEHAWRDAEGLLYHEECCDDGGTPFESLNAKARA